METTDAREVLETLAKRGHVPPDLLARLEYIEWSGEHKDLAFIPDAAIDDVLLLDDDSGWVRPDQHARWIPIAAWDGGPDTELRRVRELLETASS